MINRKNLFEEAMNITGGPSIVPPVSPTQPVSNDTGFKSPYAVSNQDALAKELSNVNKDMSVLSNKIIDSYKKNEFNLKIGMASEQLFEKFVVLLQNTLSLNNILSDSPEIQKKLAELISLAYYQAQKNPDMRFRVYSDKQVAQQVTNSIFNNLISSLKMSFLTYDSEFAGLIKKAILAVIFYIKPKKK